VKAHQRAKVKAIAETAAYNPEEAENAQRMLDATPEGELDLIAGRIRAAWGKGIEAQFEVGRELMQARAKFDEPGRATGIGKESADALFGQWFRAQEFPFGRQTAWELRVAAEREGEVRSFLAAVAQRDSSKRAGDISIATAIKMMREPARPAAIDVGETAVVDQNYAVIRAAYNKVLNPTPEGEAQANGFIGMHIDDLLKARDMLKALVEAWTAAKTAFGEGQKNAR
jgi:hypothetical protein